MELFLMRTEDGQASEEEEEEEEEEGFWEYDSTWEDGDDDDEEKKEGDGEQLEEEQEKKGAEAAPASANTEEAGNQEKPQPPGCWRPSNARWARGSQAHQRRNFPLNSRRYKSTNGRNWMAARDMQRYRRHYPDLEETDTDIQEEEMWNLSFYKNEIQFMPHGLFIEELLKKWQNDYATLEENHSYIQWLFPLREQGMNWRARLLTRAEIQAFRKSKQVMRRFIQAYKLMLGFYGIEMIDEETGELRRAENWSERFQNLNRYNHNNLRITRILKCLGEMGYEHYQVHLVKFFLRETLVHQKLPRVLQSALDYFMFTVRNRRQRRELVHFAWQHFEPKHEFVWGPRKRLLKFRPLSLELPASQRPEEEQEAARDGDAVREDETAPPNQTCTTGHAAGDLTVPVAKASTKPDVPSNDPVPDKANEIETTSTKEGDGEQANDDTEPQMGPATKPEASEMAHKSSSLVPAAKDKTEEGGNRESTPALSLQLEREGLAGESGNEDSESLKESKKRKLEMIRLSGESFGLQSPTDIEKISFNLEEVVIDKESPCSLLLAEEKAKLLAVEGDDGGSIDIKEAEPRDAMIKRRKVDKMAPNDDASEMTAKVDTSLDSFQGQIVSCTVPSTKGTDQSCQDKMKTINGSSIETLPECRIVDVDLLVNSKTTTEPGLPSDCSVPVQGTEQETTSTIEGEELESREILSAGKKEEEGGGSAEPEGGEAGKQVEEEADMNKALKAAESKNPAGKPEEGGLDLK
ncbi:opioid growth factor receptor [Hemicordylus capensis]|uniref:opioid growth factor receptor n=1 Tax=Hemicordylus capensis TaxID=884348 RepID=UPI00230326E6|nr:opioid growth factor receptor [Hemicordylus capensis]